MNELRVAQFMAGQTALLSALFEFLIKKRLVDKRELIVELYALSSQGQAAGEDAALAPLHHFIALLEGQPFGDDSVA